MRIACYTPEIAGNMGAVMRLAACFDVGIDIIEPCGFVFSDSRMRRAGMDYIGHVSVVRHPDWAAFRAAHAASRVILLTTKGDVRLPDFTFRPDDILLLGSESAGVPADIARTCTARVRIPINAAVRSLNIAIAGGIALAEALRQTGRLPE